MATAVAETDPNGAAQGLDEDEATRRLAAVGRNELGPPPRRPVISMAIAQVLSPLVLLLLGGSVVSALVGHLLDATAILVIVSINAVVGFIQEYRAEQAVVALRALTARRARVIRGGMTLTIAAAEVVPDDLLVLEPGDVVAADARVVEAYNLSASEAVLTGESLPVEKSPGDVPAGTPLAERTGDVFLGTAITSGAGKAVVTATGQATEMGKIASALADMDVGRTPLQERLAGLGRVIVVACIGLVGVVAVAAALRGIHWLEVLLTSVSLAVAAVPEGLPAVVTVALAVGVRRMSRHGVLIRRLSSVETLGSATVICTDKTGTLTRGQMTVREVVGARTVVLRAALGASDAAGDATELAILEAAHAAGIDQEELEQTNPRVAVEPFDPSTRRMRVERADGTVDVKGALEAVAAECVDQGADAELHAEAANLAARGLRVLAVASGRPGELRLLGVLGFADPPRPEAVDAIAQAHRAGIRVVMITGDHPLTAEAIGAEMGLTESDIYARATATDKLEIVRELRRAGEVVAMTGDGVNDAPSIKEADIGVAMGRTATEVTRESADMILTTDDLSGIVHAIREGRVIFGNIRKTVVYLLGGNSAELLFMIIATIAGLPLPLLPLQLLWINLLGEPLPGIALSVDPPTADVLDDPPRPRREALLARRQWLKIIAVAMVQTAVVLGAYVWALERFDLAQARTLVFSALVFGVVFRALASRSGTKIYWQLGIRENRGLALVVIISVLLQIALVYTPPTQALFEVAPLSAALLGLALALGLIPVTVVELAKIFRRLVSDRPQKSG